MPPKIGDSIDVLGTEKKIAGMAIEDVGNGKYKLDYRDSSGKRIRRTVTGKKKAEALMDRLISVREEEKATGKKIVQRIGFQEFSEKFLAYRKSTQPSMQSNDKNSLKSLNQFFGLFESQRHHKRKH